MRYNYLEVLVVIINMLDLSYKRVFFGIRLVSSSLYDANIINGCQKDSKEGIRKYTDG